MSNLITAAQRGAYEIKVTAGGQEKTLVEYLNDLAVAGGTAGVVDVITVSNSVAEAPKTSDQYNFSPSALPARRLYVPSLAELGYPGPGYELQGVVIAHLRTDNAPTEVQIRLVDDKGETVPDFEFLDEVLEENVDYVAQSGVFELTGGAAYAIDFRLTTNGAANVTLYNKVLLVRVVKL